MTEEDRDAETRIIDIFFTARGDNTKGSDLLNAIRAVHAAGVAEGIRQAREAVSDMEFDIGKFARDQVLGAIDAL